MATTNQKSTNSRTKVCTFTIEYNKDDFQFMYVIGRGGFGKVWKVQCKKTKKIFALKVMSKSKILSKKSVNSVLNERYLLS